MYSDDKDGDGDGDGDGSEVLNRLPWGDLQVGQAWQVEEFFGKLQNRTNFPIPLSQLSPIAIETAHHHHCPFYFKPIMLLKIIAPLVILGLN